MDSGSSSPAFNADAIAAICLSQLVLMVWVMYSYSTKDKTKDNGKISTQFIKDLQHRPRVNLGYIRRQSDAMVCLFGQPASEDPLRSRQWLITRLPSPISGRGVVQVLMVGIQVQTSAWSFVSKGLGPWSPEPMQRSAWVMSVFFHMMSSKQVVSKRRWLREVGSKTWRLGLDQQDFVPELGWCFLRQQHIKCKIRRDRPGKGNALTRTIKFRTSSWPKWTVCRKFLGLPIKPLRLFMFLEVDLEVVRLCLLRKPSAQAKSILV